MAGYTRNILALDDTIRSMTLAGKYGRDAAAKTGITEKISFFLVRFEAVPLLDRLVFIYAENFPDETAPHSIRICK
jgi:hypothetical protein